LRAFWAGLVLLGVSLWVAFASPTLSHGRQALDNHAFDQAAKLSPADGPRGLGAKLVHAKRHQVPAPGHDPALAQAGLQGAPAPVFSLRVSWVSAAAEGSPAQAHHYSATGPPSLPLS
jgi:hypothetical protein